MDDDTSATGPINWTYGSLEITVIATEDETEVDLIAIVLFGTIASVGALVLVSSLVIKYSVSRRRVIQDE